MLDIKFIRENPDAVKENIRKSSRSISCPWWTRSLRRMPLTGSA